MKVAPAGGGSIAKVHPACPDMLRAEPASTHGDAEAPSTGSQAFCRLLSHSAVKRTRIRWLVPLPGTLARTPTWFGEEGPLHTFTVAHIGPPL